MKIDSRYRDASSCIKHVNLPRGVASRKTLAQPLEPRGSETPPWPWPPLAGLMPALEADTCYWL